MAEIEQEVTTFYADLREAKHGFINISQGSAYQLTRAAARRLLRAVDAEKLSSDAAVYVADCIVASDDIEIEDQAVRDAIAFLEDDSQRFINNDESLWTRQEIADVLSSLA